MKKIFKGAKSTRPTNAEVATVLTMIIGEISSREKNANINYTNTQNEIMNAIRNGNKNRALDASRRNLVFKREIDAFRTLLDDARKLKTNPAALTQSSTYPQYLEESLANICNAAAYLKLESMKKFRDHTIAQLYGPSSSVVLGYPDKMNQKLAKQLKNEDFSSQELNNNIILIASNHGMDSGSTREFLGIMPAPIPTVPDMIQTQVMYPNPADIGIVQPGTNPGSNYQPEYQPPPDYLFQSVTATTAGQNSQPNQPKPYNPAEQPSSQPSALYPSIPPNDTLPSMHQNTRSSQPSNLYPSFTPDVQSNLYPSYPNSNPLSPTGEPHTNQVPSTYNPTPPNLNQPPAFNPPPVFSSPPTYNPPPEINQPPVFNLPPPCSEQGPMDPTYQQGQQIYNLPSFDEPSNDAPNETSTEQQPPIFPSYNNENNPSENQFNYTNPYDNSAIFSPKTAEVPNIPCEIDESTHGLVSDINLDNILVLDDVPAFQRDYFDEISEAVIENIPEWIISE